MGDWILDAFGPAFILTGDERYLRSAEEFFYNQVPRYGFHTGVWKDRRYYWTEYNPSGPGHPTRDATDNVNALVAGAAAMRRGGPSAGLDIRQTEAARKIA